MIRDAVIHLLNEQPLIADLPTMPAPGDLALICTNLRTMSHTRPIFVDHLSSTFVFPFAQIRFVEIPAGQGRGSEIVPILTNTTDTADDADEIEIDEDLLRRVREF